jgi:malonyl-CoA/methylmalonyl-CoA synthetase
MTQDSTLDSGLRASLAKHAKRTAFASSQHTLTYAELDKAVEDAVGWLAERSVTPGDRVLLQMDKGIAFLLLHLANMRMGSVTVPIHPLSTAQEVAYAIRDCSPLLLVCGLQEDRAQPSSLPEHNGTAVAFVSPSERPVGKAPRQSDPPQPGDLACLLYTSGTTGPPKGARLLHRQLAANIAILAKSWGWTPEDRLLHVLPLFHVHGLFVAASVALHCGATLELATRFEPSETWKALLSGRISLFMGVPTMYHRLLSAAPATAPRPTAVRLFTSGSAPLRPETLRAFEALTGQVILERYGMTEVGMAASNPLHGTRKPGSVGPALPGVGLRIAPPPTGREPDSEDIGEVQISGASIFDGYWNRPEQTEQSFTKDGWLRSGDLGFLDSDGYLHLVGREKELIISGGLNVYPREVETALDEHPYVAESAVCGVPDEDFGEAVVAGVVLHAKSQPGSIPDLEELLAWARVRLAPYKLPKRIAFLTELPRNAMGKVQKDRLSSLPELRGSGS